MRKVLFKRFLPIVWVDPDGKECPGRKPLPGSCHPVHAIEQKPGTHQWEDDYTHEGTFHCWGTESESTDNADIMDTMAIVELPDGKIEMVLPRAIKFVEPYTEEKTPLFSPGRLKRYLKTLPVTDASVPYI